MDILKKIISKIDHKGYKAYKRLKGKYHFDVFTLYIDHVQGDPFAAPSKLRVRVPMHTAGFDRDLFSNRSRKTALEDYLARQFGKTVKKISKGRRGTGKSGLILIDSGGQEILERTAAAVEEKYLEIRFYLGLPAKGRTVLGRECKEMLTFEIPEIVKRSLLRSSLDTEELKIFIRANEDQDHLREQLPKMRLSSFIKNGSVLPRRSGISQKPLALSETVLFRSPDELEVEIDLPNAGKVKGMGIPEGITIIIGGGFHGKSTVLSAIEKGVYNHIPGDGREYVSTVPSAVKIRAEEGRSIQKVDISQFISDLPMGRGTVKFSTANASGSTSQAANIIEALECETKLLLLDEDTSATNFLIRDEIMQRIVPKEKEPITPFIDQVRNIYSFCGTSSILVMGGSGDYFDVADTVIFMDSYIPHIVTGQAKKTMLKKTDKRKIEAPESFDPIKERIPIPSSFNPYRGRKKKIQSRGLDDIVFGTEEIDLSAVEQVVDKSQLEAISRIVVYALDKNYIDGGNTLKNILEKVFEDIRTKGLDVLSPFKDGHPGSLAKPRRYETAAAINRLRSLKARQY